MARPSLVRLTSASRPDMTITARPMMTISLPVIVAPVVPMSIGSDGSSCGKVSGLRDQISMPIVCRMMDTPIAVISGASRGALRKGR
ncbi:hypothetical protein D9M68_925790 [compost metagenome]